MDALARHRKSGGKSLKVPGGCPLSPTHSLSKAFEGPSPRSFARQVSTASTETPDRHVLRRRHSVGSSAVCESSPFGMPQMKNLREPLSSPSLKNGNIRRGSIGDNDGSHNVVRHRSAGAVDSHQLVRHRSAGDVEAASASFGKLKSLSNDMRFGPEQSEGSPAMQRCKSDAVPGIQSPTQRRSSHSGPLNLGSLDIQPVGKNAPNAMRDLGAFWKKQISGDDFGKSGVSPKAKFVEDMRTMVKMASMSQMQPDKKDPLSSLSTAVPSAESPRLSDSEDEGSENKEKANDNDSTDADSSDAKKVPDSKKELAGRDALRRYRSRDTGEISADLLSDVMILLDRFGVGEKEAIRGLAREVSEFATLSAGQFGEFTEKFVLWEEEHLRKQFQEHAGDEVDAADLPDFLRNLGIVNTSEVIEEIVQLAGLASEKTLDFERFKKFLAVYRRQQGFLEEELSDMWEVMKEAADEELSSDDHLMIKAADYNVMSAVLEIDMFGLWAAEYAKTIFEFMIEEEEGVDGCPDAYPVHFAEFMAWGRRLRDLFMADLWKEFQQAAGLTDELTRHQLPGVMQRLGYSLLDPDIEEFLSEAEVETPLSFDDFVAFAKACFESDGFGQADAEEFKAVFEKFDYHDNGEIDAVGVIDMIHFLGHHTGADRAQQLIKKVDFNGNGSMDIGEFMRLMRLHREEEMEQYRQIHREHSDGGRMHVVSLRHAFAKLHQGEAPTKQYMKIFTASLPEFLSLPEFIVASDKYRKHAVEKKRIHAGFSEAESEVLQQLYNRHCDKKSKRLDLGGLIWLLVEVRVPTNTKQSRSKIFNKLETARKAARDAGVSAGNVGENDNCSTYYDVLHLLRLVIRENEHLALIREEEAVSETKFSSSEVEELRTVFRDWYKKGEVSASSVLGGQVEEEEEKVESAAAKFRKVGRSVMRRKSACGLNTEMQSAASKFLKVVAEAEELDGDRELPDLETIISSRSLRMGVGAVQSLLSSIGVKLSEKQSTLLQEKADALEQGEHFQTGFDFADFLRIVRWMLDQNLGGINKVTSQLAQS
eukprot:TRINITY_DN36490_c0_g1_i1.p1 TRINITY_DN36490_c0_g1~~TRINITY_DN36490_c0_g1_i1.p1  ORF type:complete len:1046 (-),score=255.31 TRINITY_DN36490_c0_g1_i1:132-3269(-)